MSPASVSHSVVEPSESEATLASLVEDDVVVVEVDDVEEVASEDEPNIVDVDVELTLDVDVEGSTSPVGPTELVTLQPPKATRATSHRACSEEGILRMIGAQSPVRQASSGAQSRETTVPRDCTRSRLPLTVRKSRKKHK